MHSSRKLHDIAGHDSVIDALRKQHIADRVPHALLFAGPTGVGKRTTAEALSALLLCHSPIDQDACGSCLACKKFAAESHSDFRRLQPNEKNNIVLETVREVERALHLHAREGHRKVVLIPDAHRMGIPVQNALLKTLEEPPLGTHILLITHQPAALLATIRSRCQTMNFGPLPISQVETIIEHQRPNLDAHQRCALAHLSNGAPGQALRLEAEDVLARIEHIHALDTLFDPRRLDAPRDLSSRAMALAKDRQELSLLIEGWLVWVRDQVLLATGADEGSLVHVAYRSALRTLAEQRGVDQVIARAEVLMHARAQLDRPHNLNPTMLMEQVLLSLAGQLPVPS